MICFNCLKTIHTGNFCTRCKKELFDGISVSRTLSFTKPEFNTIRREMSERLSISGVQNKISLTVKEKCFEAAKTYGKYILKPSSGNSGLQFEEYMSENEHITMQIARQLFNIHTASCALLAFPDGENVYLTRRFDRNGESKLRQEDFCQLSNRSEDTHGKNFKYDSSYEEVGSILKKFCPSYKVESVKLFSLILFSYIIGNGDLHLKNFSLLESEYGDFNLSPAYDLMNTTLHLPNEKRTALEMFEDYETDHFKKNGFYGKEDFLYLASQYEIPENLAESIIQNFLTKTKNIPDLVNLSLMNDEAKMKYCEIVSDRVKALT
jgi:serine/threonine-protein kinase HipA